MATYECNDINPHTQECTNWQLVTPPPNVLTITKQDADMLTWAICGFMVTVWVFNQIKRSL